MSLFRQLSDVGRPARQGQCRRAFTLIEVMIVVVIVGIIAVGALPMLSDMSDTTLASAARLLMADIEFAQVDSIAHSDDPCVFVVDQANARYWLARSSDTVTPITNPADDRPYLVTFGSGRAAELSGVTIQSYSLGGDDKLAFGRYGQPDETTEANVTLAAGANTIRIVIDPESGETSIP